MSHTSTRQSDQAAAPPAIPDPEVVVKPKRRQFTADYKRRILQEAEACTQPGEIGALLRREGLYSSHLTTWRHQRQRGELQGLAPAKRGRKADPQAAEIAQLRREKARLQAQVERAELIIEVQKKLSHLLGLPETGSDDNT
jgi:transposase-like protein